MSSKVFIQLILILFLLRFPTLAADISIEKKYLNQNFWLRHSLIFFQGTELPTVFSNNIIYTDHCDGIEFRDRILHRGDVVKILKMDKEGELTKITLIEGKDEFKIFVVGAQRNKLKKSLELIFSDCEVERYTRRPRDPRNKKEVIKYFGFPITSCRQGDVEVLTYTLDFSESSAGIYGAWEVRIKKGKVASITGSI